VGIDRERRDAPRRVATLGGDHPSQAPAEEGEHVGGALAGNQSKGTTHFVLGTPIDHRADLIGADR
jgi:hypothetical protein